MTTIGGLVACQSSPDPQVTQEGDQTTVQVTMSPNCNLIAEVEIETSVPTRVRTEVRHSDRPTRHVPRTEFSTVHSFAVSEMRAQASYTLEFFIEDEEGEVLERHARTFETGSLPPLTAPNVVSSTLQDDGELFLFGPAAKDPSAVELSDEPLVIAVDRDGEVVWYLKNPGVSAAFAPRDVRIRDDGYFVVLVPGGWNLFTLDGEVVRKYRAPREDLFLHHDAIDLPGGGFATLAGNTRTLDIPEFGGEVQVRGDHLLELSEDGEL
ncbi:MAG: aryl-sulfate sulfotransferase, partial [Nannocystaceae bacterium]